MVGPCFRHGLFYQDLRRRHHIHLHSCLCQDQYGRSLFPPWPLLSGPPPPPPYPPPFLSLSYPPPPPCLSPPPPPCLSPPSLSRPPPKPPPPPRPRPPPPPPPPGFGV